MIGAALDPFMHGALTVVCFVIGVVFLRFWRLSRDRFFLWFLAAFWVFSFGWGLRAFVPSSEEHRYLMYLPRLLGFVLILIAIFDKNRRRVPP